MLWLLLLAPFIDMCICLFLVYNILKVYQILLLDILYLITCDKPSSPLSLHQESSFNTPCSSCLFRFSSIVGGIFSSASYNWARVVGLLLKVQYLVTQEEMIIQVVTIDMFLLHCH